MESLQRVHHTSKRSKHCQLVDAQIMIREEEHKLYTMMFRGLRDLFYKGNIFTEALKKWRMTDCFEIMGN